MTLSKQPQRPSPYPPPPPTAPGLLVPGLLVPGPGFSSTGGRVVMIGALNIGGSEGAYSNGGLGSSQSGSSSIRGGVGGVVGSI